MTDDKPVSDEAPAEVPYVRATARQKQIVQLKSMGLQAKDIGAQLGISLKTVEVHSHNLLKKFDCNNSTQLCCMFLRKRWII